MSAHNICFGYEIRKLIYQLHTYLEACLDPILKVIDLINGHPTLGGWRVYRDFHNYQMYFPKIQ